MTVDSKKVYHHYIRYGYIIFSRNPDWKICKSTIKEEIANSFNLLTPLFSQGDELQTEMKKKSFGGFSFSVPSSLL